MIFVDKRLSWFKYWLNEKNTSISFMRKISIIYWGRGRLANCANRMIRMTDCKSDKESQTLKLFFSLLPFVYLSFQWVQIIALHSVHDKKRGPNIPCQKKHSVHEMCSPQISWLHLNLFLFVYLCPGKHLLRCRFGASIGEFSFDNSLAFEVFVREVLFWWVNKGIVKTAKNFFDWICDFFHYN